MNLMILELAVVVLGLGILLGDLWTAAHQKHLLGYAAAALLGVILLASFFGLEQVGSGPAYAFNNMLVLDGLAVFFKRFFLIAAILVLLMSVEFSNRIQSGISEFYCLILFALTGMMFAASANDFIMVFVALELISVTFYVLNSFQRNRLASLEAGIKYLILSALSAAFLVFGIALVFGTTTFTNFADIQRALVANPALAGNGLFLLGVLMIIVGLGFKIAAFPFQIWAPDVYQGSPTPSTAFLAVGSKAAGIVLLLRVLFVAVPAVTQHWSKLLIIISAITILYGNLCAIPQRNLKRLLGYSSISNAGYLLLGFAALSQAGKAAILYYLAGYLFTVVAAFTVICLVTRDRDSDDITVLAGLHRRSPLLAMALTMAMVSLAGIPPLAGFFGKFLLLKAVVEQGATNSAYYWLVGITVFGVVISLYYYFGVIRAIYWSKDVTDFSPITVSWPAKLSLVVCMAAILYLGLLPGKPLKLSEDSALALTTPVSGSKQLFH
ncbi:MAG: NADH-quinone oxidoreductase subunit [Verrucomicrobiales bacterium]|nr:NADH-quinone oxidoreductase subunit [Verrucomicrobiales bacterium]